MIYDLLAESDEVRELLIQRCREGLIEILVTHIQFDQLAAIKDPVKRDVLLATAMVIPSTRVATDGGVWGTSIWGEFTWGGGSGDVKIDDIAHGNPKHNPDGLLVSTAAARADIFVTEETRLPKRIRRYNPKLRVASFSEFGRLLTSLN
jgi:hypothetical protein